MRRRPASAYTRGLPAPSTSAATTPVPRSPPPRHHPWPLRSRQFGRRPPAEEPARSRMQHDSRQRRATAPTPALRGGPRPRAARTDSPGLHQRGNGRVNAPRWLRHGHPFCSTAKQAPAALPVPAAARPYPLKAESCSQSLIRTHRVSMPGRRRECCTPHRQQGPPPALAYVLRTAYASSRTAAVRGRRMRATGEGAPMAAARVRRMENRQTFCGALPRATTRAGASCLHRAGLS